MNKDTLVARISQSIKNTEPTATVILYGSYARGDQHLNSDVDILILLDKERITPDDEQRISYPLYEIEFETGHLISPLVLAKKDWEKRHHITPFYKNVVAEGIAL